MGYEIRMQSDIVALLNLFAEACSDKVSNRQVRELAASSSAWIRGHSVFDELRDRNLAAISAGDRMKAAQSCFEEACVKSLYNEVVSDGFDVCSPYWIVPNALMLARVLKVPAASVEKIVAS